MKDVSRQTGVNAVKIFDANNDSIDVDIEAEVDALLNVGGCDQITKIGQFLSIEDYLVRNQNQTFNLLVPQKPQVFKLKFENEQ
jgi:hypothetical protein